MRKKEIEMLAYVMANPIRVAILRYLAEGDKEDSELPANSE